MQGLINWFAILLSVSMAFAPFGLQAAIYKWTDEDGQVHFSDKPPTQKSSRTMNVPIPKPQSAQDGASGDRLNKQLKAIDSLSKSREEREKKRAEKQAAKKRQEEQCKQLKAKIKHSESVNTYYRYTEDGDVEYLSDEEGNALRAQMKQEYRQNCR